MFKKYSLVMIFLIGLIIGILVCNIINLTSTPVYADASAGTSSGIIAVTGLLSNSYSGLWVLDARESRTSPSLCLYAPYGSRGLRLIGARRIKWDLQLIRYNDKTQGRNLNPSRMQAIIEEINKKESK